jgi:hypothetical protein
MGLTVRVHDERDAAVAQVELGKALRAGRWDLVAQWSGALHRFARRRAKGLAPVEAA